MVTRQKTARLVAGVISFALFCSALGVLGVWASITFNQTGVVKSPHISLFMIVVLLATGGQGFWRMARTKSATDLRLKDERRPVLILRSFADDKKFKIQKGSDFRRK